MMRRKYCTVHDSLWDRPGFCEASAILHSYMVEIVEPCDFVYVNMVRKGKATVS